MKEIPLGYLNRLNSQTVEIVSSEKHQPQNCPHYPKLLVLVGDSQLEATLPVNGWLDALAPQE